MKRPSTGSLAVAVALAVAGCSSDGGDPAAVTAASPSGTPRPQLGTWTALAEMPQARTEFSAAALDGAVYVAGGLHQGSGGPYLTLRYEPGSDSWTELAPAPEARHHAPLAAYDGSVYLIGGFTHTGFQVATNTLFIYDVAGGSWRQGPPLPVPVAAQAVATTDDGRIHVIGGVGEGGGVGNVTDEHQVFDTATETWETLPAPSLAREHHGAAYLDGVLYVAAGRSGAQGNELEAYDIETQEWTRLPDAPTSGRSGVAVVAFEGQVYVLGGEQLTRGVFDQVERYDPERESWQEVTPLPVGRHGLGAVAVDDGIIAVGGAPRLGVDFTRTTEIWQP